MMEIMSIYKIGESKEIADAMFPKRNIYIVHGFSIFLLIYVLYLCYQSNLVTRIALIVIAIAGIIILQFILFKQKKNFLHIIYERFQETNSTDEIIYHYKFNDQDMVIINTNTDAHVEINYNSFCQYLETTNYVLVVSKAKQYIIFNRDVAKQYDLKNFFKKKVPSIRIQE